jgi:hypothetical protein
MTKNAELDADCEEAAKQLVEAHPEFRFVLIAVDSTGVCNPILTADPRLCRHALQRILKHAASFPELVEAGGLPVGKGPPS